MTKRRRSRSEAAKRGWETRRRKQREAERAARKRSAAAKRGWATRRAKVAPPTVTPPRPRRPRLPVYDVREIERGAELGYATTREQAEQVAEGARPDLELDSVWKGDGPGGEPAWLAAFRPPVYDEPLDDLADEWEIGFEYRGADKGSHVDVNIRIAREDGKSFGPREAQRVLDQFRANLGTSNDNPVPSGYRMAMIDWRRPRWSMRDWQSGSEGDLASFHAPMYVESGNPSVWSITPTGDTRLGSVKK